MVNLVNNNLLVNLVSRLVFSQLLHFNVIKVKLPPHVFLLPLRLQVFAQRLLDHLSYSLHVFGFWLCRRGLLFFLLSIRHEAGLLFRKFLQFDLGFEFLLRDFDISVPQNPLAVEQSEVAGVEGHQKV